MIRLAAIFCMCFLAACATEFDEYNDVTGLRLLGLRAQPPELQPEEESLLDALVVAENASYQWTWCPAPYSGDARDECPISEAELRAVIASLDPDAEVPDYDLGNTSEVSFTHSLPPALLADFCEQLENAELPEGFKAPRCNGRFTVSIRLVVQDGDAQIAATRELPLIYEDEVVSNQNPTISGGEISVRGAPPFVLSTDAPTMVTRDVEYKLTLDIDAASAETFSSEDETGPIEDREILSMTWFYEAGSMDKSRSSFIDGFTDIDNLRENLYTTPISEDFSDDELRLFFVLRDDRGGLNWLESRLELVE